MCRTVFSLENVECDEGEDLSDHAYPTTDACDRGQTEPVGL